MHIIKCNAIASTNDYLKELNKKMLLESFTVVVANNQEKGKGQRGFGWQTESGKNLTFSILVKNNVLDLETIYCFNALVSLCVFKVVQNLTTSKVYIKWPNDILADQRKICGILIENTIKENQKIEAIVGIGLNVNQEYFEDLPKAISLKMIEDKDFDLQQILISIVSLLENRINEIEHNANEIWQEYHKHLFQLGISNSFEDLENNLFNGIIKGVSSNGLLEVELENKSIRQFGLKEIKMLY